jgi:hypothetical protein
MVTDVAGFGHQCEAMLRGDATSAALDSLEPELKVALEAADRVGHIRVQVDITPDHLSQSHRLLFEIDQSYLQGAVKQCAAVVQKYPIRGE